MEMISCKNHLGNAVSLPREKFFFRPSVYGLIVRDGKILTMRNKGSGKLWFPGGGIEKGERMEEALRREIREETGLEVEIGEMALFRENFFYYAPLDEAYHAFLFFFVCMPLAGRLKTDNEVDDLESQTPRWTDLRSIEKEDIGDLENELYELIGTLA
ncbi:MAG: NUDIX domain-containing protein [Candidatus Moranbacteria bacterium]|nr:NUDIX domain-containing protein [Candidatus Moranbacteria bacterium]NTW76050.1 NUDIX domain-containing protein [Candidatus Moranbacteria bacterium]